MKKSELFTLKVGPEDHGSSLLAVLKKHLSEHSSKELKKMIESKLCLINGRVEFFSSCKVMQGDVIELSISSKENEGSLQCKVVYEDNDLYIVNKPAGIVSDIVELSKAVSYKGSLYLVHRLDKDTSGLLILAKSQSVFELMKDLFAKRLVQKYYLAIADSYPLKSSGKINNFLAKKGSYQGQTLYASASGGQRAITIWRVLERGRDASLFLLEPKTGRTHQLRVHLKEMGCPILGDYQYAMSFKCKCTVQRHMLHAWGLYFIHPIKKEEVLLQAPLPEDFCKVASQVKVNLHAASDRAFLRSEVAKLLQ